MCHVEYLLGDRGKVSPVKYAVKSVHTWADQLLSFYHLSLPPQSTTLVYHLSLPPQYTTSVYHLSLPPQSITSVYHLSLPPKSTTSVYHLSLPPQSTTSVDHLSLPPHSTTRHGICYGCTNIIHLNKNSLR